MRREKEVIMTWVVYVIVAMFIVGFIGDYIDKTYNETSTLPSEIDVHKSQMNIIEERGVARIEHKIEYIDKTMNENDKHMLAAAILRCSNRYSIEENLLISIAYVESNFKRYAKSPKGCLGYFQINVNVHNVDMDKIYDAQYNTELGCLIYRDFLYIHGYNQEEALNSYNGWNSAKNPYANNVLRYKAKLDEIEEKAWTK